MLVTEFGENYREEHRQLRDALLAVRSALEVGDTDAVRNRIEELEAASGPHFYYEGEALYPALAELYGDEYVDRLQAEHEQTLAAARELTELAQADELSAEEAERALDLIGDLLPHVSECDGIAVMVEVLPTEQVKAIVKARKAAHQKRATIHEAAKRRARRRVAGGSAVRGIAKGRGKKRTAAKKPAAKVRATRKGGAGKVAHARPKPRLVKSGGRRKVR
jgi:Hemerythrin HHE cation binding domain